MMVLGIACSFLPLLAAGIFSHTRQSKEFFVSVSILSYFAQNINGISLHFMQKINRIRVPRRISKSIPKNDGFKAKAPFCFA